jgi:hypothetical protein
MLYGFMYAKPSRRLAAALTADREILALFSTFPDQQQRESLGTRLWRLNTWRRCYS